MSIFEFKVPARLFCHLGAKGLNISNHAEPRILLERRPVLSKAPPQNDAPRYITAPGELTGLDRLHWLHSHRHKQQQEASRRLNVCARFPSIYICLIMLVCCASCEQEARRAMPQRPRSMSCDAAGVCVFKGVQVSLQNKLGLLFCVDCPDPHAEGSYSKQQAKRARGCATSLMLPACAVDTWESRLFPEGFHVDSELVVGVPNDGSCPPLTPVGGTIVLYFRGNVRPLRCPLAPCGTVWFLSFGPIEKYYDFCDLRVREKDWHSRARVTPATSPASHCLPFLSACTTH